VTAEPSPAVFVVDDDPAVGRAVAGAAQLLGLPVRLFTSAADFLAGCAPAAAGCLVLDICMPGMTGLELQRKLADSGITLPIIMVSGHADVPIAVEVMTRGAVTLLEKPFRLDALVAAVRRALEQDAAARAARARRAEAQAQLSRLTDREREVLERVIAGRTNRQIADELYLSVRAVEDRRGRLMKKLGVRTVAELVRLVPTGAAPVEPDPG
jgi:FixJ family two-component response regulator